MPHLLFKSLILVILFGIILQIFMLVYKNFITILNIHIFTFPREFMLSFYHFILLLFYRYIDCFQIYTSPELSLVALTIVPPLAGFAIFHGRFVRTMTKKVSILNYEYFCQIYYIILLLYYYI